MCAAFANFNVQPYSYIIPIVNTVHNDSAFISIMAAAETC